MKEKIINAFQNQLKELYDNIFKKCKPFNNQGINEQNLTFNFAQSLKNILDKDTGCSENGAVCLFELKLKENGKHSRVDGFVYDKTNGKEAAFFIESKKFKRSGIKKYGDSLTSDIKRLSYSENRNQVLKELCIDNQIEQYLIFLFDHWYLNDSKKKEKDEKKVKEWIDKRIKELSMYNVFSDFIEICVHGRTKEHYYIYIIAVKVNPV